MPKEIERKFLVHSFEYRGLGKKTFFHQGYLSIGDNKTIRARTAGEKAFLTIKASSEGISRDEYEYEIPLNEANEILDNICIKPTIEKYRFHIEYKGFKWEVDEFTGVNHGLVIAEIELESEDQEFEKPPWIGKEVTGDPKYFNANLVQYPYNQWYTD